MSRFDVGDILGNDPYNLDGGIRGFVPGFYTHGCLWTLTVMVLLAAGLLAWLRHAMGLPILP
jgi:hypothetical protein